MNGSSFCFTVVLGTAPQACASGADAPLFLPLTLTVAHTTHYLNWKKKKLICVLGKLH